MNEQPYSKLMGEIKAKRERILSQTDSSEPPSAEQQAGQQSQQNTTGTAPAAPAPASGRERQRTNGRKSRRQQQ